MGLKAWLVKKEIGRVLAPYDTKEEMDKIMEEQVQKGIPPWLANIGAVVLSAVVITLQTSDINLAMTDPKTYLKWLVVAVITRLLAQMQPPGTVVKK